MRVKSRKPPAEYLITSLSVTVSRSSSVDSVQTLWPHSFGNARIAYQFAPSGATLALLAVYAHHRRAFNDVDDQVQNPLAQDQLDLRLTYSSPVRPVPGLSVRSGVGARLLPDQPYVVTVPSTNAPNDPRQYQHAVPQLHLLVGVNYDF